MSFKRDFYVCECGHLMRDHSNNYPRTKCLANPECKCEKFSRLTKRGADLSKRGRNLPAKSNQSESDLPA